MNLNSTISEQNLVPDEQALKKAIDGLYDLLQQFSQRCESLEEDLANEKESHLNEVRDLRRTLEDNDTAKARLERALADSQRALAESRHGQNSLQLKWQQLSESLQGYRSVIEDAERLASDLRNEKAEVVRLKTHIDEMKSEAQRMERIHKDNVECLALTFQQEQLVIQEQLQAAEDRNAWLQEGQSRLQGQISQAEDQRGLMTEELERVKREEKQRYEKLRAELLHQHGLLSDQERAFQDLQKDTERRCRLAANKVEQEHRSAIEQLTRELEDKTRQLSLAEFRLKQAQEDYEKNLTSIKMDFDSKLNIKADEVRRQIASVSDKSPR